MKFTLLYEGNLWPTGNNVRDRSKKKWEVRAQCDPQLRNLWQERPDLDHLRHNSIVPRDGFFIWDQAHPLYPEAARPNDFHTIRDGRDIDLCEPVSQPGGARTFFPLVRKSLGLTCGLKIVFLRNEPKGSLFDKQTGDLDNRLKTLVDGLGVPTDDGVYDDPTLINPVYCLLESDALVTALEVRTEQLLSPRGTHDKEVRLMVEVDVRVSHPRAFNMMFSGD